MTIYSAALTLILVMDPLGNVPMFLSILNGVEPKRRSKIILRESLIAFLILTAFLFFGQHILHGLNISDPALSIAGGIVLFLISLKMIFPQDDNHGSREHSVEEPFIVPLAIPLVAGPSAIATVMLFASQAPALVWSWFLSLAVASVVCTVILLIAPQLKKILRQRGLTAMERLMGMILTTIAVQMFLTGISQYLHQ